MAGSSRFPGRRSAWAALAVAASAWWPMHAHALFGDDDARKAIIELRQRFDAYKATSEAAINELKQGSVNQRSVNQRSLIELSNQIEQLRAELAQVRGQNEELARQVSELQRQQKDTQRGVDDRLREMEPIEVTLDGQAFRAMPAEKRDYEAALGALRSTDFVQAEAAFHGFLRQYPDSGFKPSVLYWLGNAQYANRKYREAVGTHRQLINTYPSHPRVPEALLAVANSQVELKDVTSAKRTLNDLVKAHPRSEAAMAARERLATLR